MSDEKQTEAAPAEQSRPHTTLKVTGPSWCTSITFPETEDGTLVIDRQGVTVLVKGAKALIETAAQHGVTITEVSDK